MDIFFRSYFSYVNVIMFSYFEPNFIEKFLRKSDLSNFGHLTFFAKREFVLFVCLFFGGHLKRTNGYSQSAWLKRYCLRTVNLYSTWVLVLHVTRHPMPNLVALYTIFALTLVLLRGVVPTPLTVIALVLKIAQPRGKIMLRVPSSSSFPFILAKKFRTYHLHRG